jgi:hypothetical protein
LALHERLHGRQIRQHPVEQGDRELALLAAEALEKKVFPLKRDREPLLVNSLSRAR